MPVSIFPNNFWQKSVKRFGRGFKKPEFTRKIVLDKRAKFVLGTVLLTSVFLWGNLTPGTVLYKAFLLGASCFLFAVFCFWGEIGGPRFFLALILPIFFSVFFLCFIKGLALPLFVKAMSPLFFGLGIYSIFLTINIFNICLERMIPLFRAAQTVGFLFTVITSLFAFSFVLFLRLSFWQNGFWVGLVSFPLIFQALWSVNPKQKVSKKLLILSLALALVIGELAAAISFWPVVSTLGALFLVSVLYALVGISQLYLAQRLNQRRVIEYASIAVVVLVLMTVSTRWG